MKKRILLIFLPILLCLLLSSCGKTDLTPGEAEAVLSRDGRTVTVTAVPDESLKEMYKDSKLYLFSLPAGSRADAVNDPTVREQVAEAAVRGTVRFKIPLENPDISGLYRSYVPAFFDRNKNIFVPAISTPVYVKNPSVLAVNRSAFPTQASLKGIVSEHDTDAELLGVSNVIIDIPIEDYVTTRPTAEDYGYIFGGSSAFLKKSAIDRLDRRIERFSAAGINVYFRFILGTAYTELPDSLKCLGFETDVTGREDYAVNMADPTTSKLVSGLADQLAARYIAKGGNKPGVCAFIAGRSLNSPGRSIGAGDYDLALRSAEALTRVLYLAMVSHYENGKVFLTVDSYFKVSPGGNGGASGTRFISDFDTNAKITGNYPWGVAVATESSALDSDRIWYDESGGGKYLTPSNYEALTVDLLGVESYFYAGERRDVIISDFSSRANDALPENQATSIAYAYYKAVADGNISAFFYSAQCDTEKEACGLRAIDDELRPAQPRVSYRLYRDVDTDADISDIISKTDIGSKWTKLSEETAEKVTVRRSRSGEAGKTENTPENYDSKLLYGFDDSTTDGFFADGEGCYVKIGNSALTAELTHISTADIATVRKTDVNKNDLRNDILLMTVSVVSASDITPADGYIVTLILKQGNELVYSSSVGGVKGNTNIWFDISEFIKAAGKGNVEMWLYAAGRDGSQCRLTVSDIYNCKVKTNTVLVVLLIILIAVAVTAIVVLTVIWLRKNFVIEFGRKDKKPAKNPTSGGKKGKSEKTVKAVDPADDDVKVNKK